MPVDAGRLVQLIHHTDGEAVASAAGPAGAAILADQSEDPCGASLHRDLPRRDTQDIGRVLRHRAHAGRGGQGSEAAQEITAVHRTLPW